MFDIIKFIKFHIFCIILIISFDIKRETKLETTKIQEEIAANEIEKITELVKEAQLENTNEKVNLNEESEMSTNKILVAYFSATGNTKRVAEKIAEM